MEEIMKKLTLIISTSLVLALIAGSVFAWGNGKCQKKTNNDGGQSCQGYSSNAPCSQYNDLTQEQKDELTALRQAFIDDTYELRSAQMEKRQQVKLLMQTSNPGKDELVGLYDEIGALGKQIRDKRIDFQLAAKAIAPDLKMGPNFKNGKRGMGNGGGCNRHGGPGSGGDKAQN